MNAFVHTIMYFYFAFCTFPAARRVLLPHGHLITSIQIAQMVIGVAVNLVATHELAKGRACHVSNLCVAMAGLLYSIYLQMFVSLALQRGKKKAD